MHTDHTYILDTDNTPHSSQTTQLHTHTCTHTQPPSPWYISLQDTLALDMCLPQLHTAQCAQMCNMPMMSPHEHTGTLHKLHPCPSLDEAQGSLLTRAVWTSTQSIIRHVASCGVEHSPGTCSPGLLWPCVPRPGHTAGTLYQVAMQCEAEVHRAPEP